MSVIEVAVDRSSHAGQVHVQVVDSPVGHASASAELDAGALLAERGRFEQALLLSGIAARRIPDAQEQLVQDVGRTLFRALLGTGEVAGRYRAAVAVADERDESLRIVLRIDAPELAALPWEAMYDAESGGYVCRQHQLVRHIPVAAGVAPLRVAAPLRLLGVVASPHGLPPLAAGKEREQLARALAEPVSSGLIEFAWTQSATWADLQERLMAGPWHVIHFIGHGDFDAVRDEGRVALITEEGEADLVEASRLADLLRQARPVPRLVVLNSCEGAAASTSDLFAGTASVLVRNRVTAVAAMQYPISDAAAIAFARGFYSALAHGRGVDDAVSSGRTAILGVGSRTLEWLTPVLYLRGRDARLFDVAPPPAGARTEPPPEGARTEPPPATTEEPTSSWTWSRQKTRTARTLGDYAGAVNEIAYHPDGSLLATSSNDKTVRLWDAATGSAVQVLRGHTSGVSPLAFSLDGKLLASASNWPGGQRWGEKIDTAVRTWDPGTGRRVQVLRGHAYAVNALAFSPDSRLLASASLDQTVKVWDDADAPRHTLTAKRLISRVLSNNPLWSVAFSPAGTWIAGGGNDKTVRLWDTVTGQPHTALTGLQRPVRSVAFSPDGTLLAAHDDNEAMIWRLASEPGGSGHSIDGSGPSFSPDGKLLITRRGNAALLWDTESGSLHRSLRGHTRRVECAVFSPDGRYVVTASSDHTAWVWSVDTGERVSELRHPGAVYKAVWSPGGAQLATVGADQAVRLWPL
jgi:WD40 repeat protein